jgi:hypothetical protein
LKAPNGITINLTSDNGGGGDNFIDTVLDDEAATSITSGSPPFTGSYRPEEALSTFDGLSAQGSWTLKVVDDAYLDQGTLDSWSLHFTFDGGSCASAGSEESGR